MNVTPIRPSRRRKAEDSLEESPRKTELPAASVRSAAGYTTQEVAKDTAATKETAAQPPSPGTASQDTELAPLLITSAEGGVIEFGLDGHVYRVSDHAAFQELVAEAPPAKKSPAGLAEAQRVCQSAVPVVQHGVARAVENTLVAAEELGLDPVAAFRAKCG